MVAGSLARCRSLCRKDGLLDGLGEQLVVLKVYDFGPLMSRTQFMRQLRIVDKLDHAHIAPIDGYFVDFSQGIARGVIQLPFYENGNLLMYLRSTPAPLLVEPSRQSPLPPLEPKIKYPRVSSPPRRVGL
jgi:hypothetical protein